MTDKLLMYAILALDSYNEGYGRQLVVNLGDSNELGDASVLPNDGLLPTDAESVGFYASTYDWDDQTIISYRGTDNLAQDAFYALR